MHVQPGVCLSVCVCVCVCVCVRSSVCMYAHAFVVHSRALSLQLCHVSSSAGLHLHLLMHMYVTALEWKSAYNGTCICKNMFVQTGPCMMHACACITNREQLCDSLYNCNCLHGDMLACIYQNMCVQAEA